MRDALTAVLRALVAGAIAAVALAGCGSPPRPFEHNVGSRYPVVEAGKIEVTIAPPARMPEELGMRVAAALAVELQSYGILAVVQPNDAPARLGGVMATRDADLAIEIEISWYVEQNGRTEGPVVSKTRTTPQDYADSTDRLVSRIAQQAAPRVATMMGRPPNFTPSSPGQVAAGVSVLPQLPADTASMPVLPPSLPGQKPGTAPPPPSAQPAAATSSQLKVMVAPVTGAPSDGNRQLFSGMRRALGSSKMVIVDRGGGDVFVVVGTVALTPVDDRSAQLVIKWVLKDPAGKEIGELEQANRVPLTAVRGSWAGFGDIVGAAAAEGIIELLNKAANIPR
jgi:hypothetical protein